MADPLNCEACNKRLSRKSARLIHGKILCSSCMWKPLGLKLGDTIQMPTPASKPFPECRVVGFTANKLKVG